MNAQIDLQKKTTEKWGWRYPVPQLFILGEDIKVSSIGHAFGKDVNDNETYWVHDFLIDQSQSTKGGAALTSKVQLDLSKSPGYQYIIFPPYGKKFHVQLPQGVDKAYFSLDLGRCNPATMGGYFGMRPATITFFGVAGSQPIIKYNSFFINHDNNSAFHFDIQGEVVSDFEFDKVIIMGSYGNRNFLDPGAKWYEPLSYAVPFGTTDIYPKSETYCLFGYHTQHTSDPGRFVNII